jgi:hypothetical protein
MSGRRERKSWRPRDPKKKERLRVPFLGGGGSFRWRRIKTWLGLSRNQDN